MDKAVEKYRKRRTERLRARYDALDWITLKNGVHVPIEDGEAVGGPIKGETVGKKKGVKRGQIEAKGGKVPDDQLAAFNKEALQSIMDETGYKKVDARRFQIQLNEYFGGDYSAFTDGEKKNEENIINEGLKRMGAYDGPIYRGMKFDRFEDAADFAVLQPGDELTMKSISSWTSDPTAARDFSNLDRPGMTSVVIMCNNNKTGVGVQHLSKFRDYEAEVLAPSTSKWRVGKVTVKSKLDVYKDLIDEYEKKDSLTKHEDWFLKQLKHQLKINGHVLRNRRYVTVEVDEI